MVVEPSPPNVMVSVNKNLKRNTIKIAETMKSRNETKSTTLTQKTETSKNSADIEKQISSMPSLQVL
jgi:hypothetical protein